ncbi:hypothetical protein KY290_026408 [Solanum tuberosum]|uniref:Uncharacterized protein n=1 Tax=Solanum tuberosum TaxID=4113 RepID=A0ABQ7UWC9_SOLTU|nr:hypothetical protein KY289_025470 [Solanum tuberosum]KAH0674314.1 hypothetical protein KY284_025401 [Solanum tuberosum]KAH0677464.1 hypothetical protein KY285_025265 [Solanum tuberosum]KAH0756138.1 hypothetical protein KY290_026408 [Solanum tuberosum]
MDFSPIYLRLLMAGSLLGNVAILFPQEVEEEEPVVSPKVILNSDSGSDDSKLNSVHSSSGSDDPDRNNNKSNRCPDERKRKRTTSNRESARRSRMIKKMHLEILRNRL